MDYQEKRRAQSRQTERAILQAALELMKDQSFEAVSVREICARAGITTGAFYHHFPSKEALLAKGFGALDRYVEERLAQHAGEPPADRLEAILSAYAEFIEEESGPLTARYYQLRLSNAQMGIRLDPTHFVEKAMVDCFREAQAAGQLTVNRSPEWAARFCHTHFRGLALDWVLSGCSYPLRERMMDEYTALRSLLELPAAD